MSDSTAQAVPSTPPPLHVVLHDFLDAEMHQGLLDWALENEARFVPTLVGGGQPGGDIRISRGLSDLGPLNKPLRERAKEALPRLLPGLGMRPFPFKVEQLELVAHNDGAQFKRHVDTNLTGAGPTLRRVVSAVYYFHAEPKAFSGGELRIYGLGPNASSVDVFPDQNTLAAFPSFMPHEVRPVSCPSKRFLDSRFAINIWFHRPPAEAGTP
jgi:Rps23 Pro-64 3,4-dihydroxylase Tpa1-like proline 4-hydroxylase